MTDRLILMHLLNATEKRQTQYINNKTIGPMPAGLWIAMWILYSLWILRNLGFRYLAVDFAFRFLGSWIA